MRSTSMHHTRRRAAVSAAVAGALLLATAGVASAAEAPSSVGAPPVSKAALTSIAAKNAVARPRSGKGKLVRRSGTVRTTFDHTEHRDRAGGYSLARTYAEQAISLSGSCAAYAGIGRTSQFLSSVGARRPSAATPILRAVSPIYKFASWLVGKFYTPPCDVAKQLAVTAATITSVAYWESAGVYHRVHIQKHTRRGAVDLCRFAAYTYFRVRGQWYVTQTASAHLPARGGWGDCRP